MPVKRTREPLFLPQSPLEFVLAQVRIDPVLAVENYVPDIQETLRKQGFPKMRTRQSTSRITSGNGQTLRAETKHQWEFHDVENHTSIMVDQDAIAIQTTHYSRYEEFDGLIRLALEATGSAMGFTQVTRCGLRYIDAMAQPASGDWKEVLIDSLLGFQPQNGMARASSFSQTELVTGESSHMRLRCLTQPQGIVLPPDLMPCDLAFRRNPKRQQPFAILDLDHYQTTAFDFDLQVTLDCLAELHDALDQTFRDAVNPNALEQWKQPLENPA